MTAPYVKNSDTSIAAAASLPEPALARLEAQVFAVVQKWKAHGVTDDELEIETGLSHQTVSARRRGLVQKGRIVDSGLRRQTRSGRKASVWIPGRGAVEAGTAIGRVPRPSNEVLRWGAQEIRAILSQGQLFHRGRGELETIARWLEQIARE
jgi:hypothetical protein